MDRMIRGNRTWKRSSITFAGIRGTLALCRERRIILGCGRRRMPRRDAVGRRNRCTRGACAPRDGSPLPQSEQEQIDIAFRVIADHIRTLSFAIADGIQPGNNDRNYVLRRILRRAVRYGRTLGFHEPFFYKLVDVLADTMGDVFPEIRARKKHVQEIIRAEEEAFNKTLDRGIELFETEATAMANMRSTQRWTCETSHAMHGIPR